MFAWPKAIHEGSGEAFVVISPEATPAQRGALLTILTGQETEPGATIFNVFATVIDTFHEPVFAPIDFQLDLDGRTGRVRVEGIIDTAVEPIRNPVTGAEHRVSVLMPGGFEYKKADYASGNTKAGGRVALDWTRGHAHVAMLDLSTRGAA
jgi:hypothetical protein